MRRNCLGIVVALCGAACAHDDSSEAGTEAWAPTEAGDADDDTEGPDTTGPTATSGTSASPTGGPPNPSSSATSASTTGPTSTTSTSGPTEPTADPTADPTAESSGASSTGPTATACSADELELISLTNAYRAENGLPEIPASPSLCVVGNSHAEDLENNAPHAPADCNLHSWSNTGAWSGCCYTADHAQAQCMWSKPAELTDYPGNGYENAAGGGGTLTPAGALELWKNSPGHNAVILNEGTWADRPWGALGAGMYAGYAVLWFGEEADPAQ